MRPKARWCARRGARVLWTEGPVRTPQQVAWAGNASRGALRGWRGLGGSNEVHDVIPGGCAGRLMRLPYGELRVRGNKDAHRRSDGQHNDECDVSYLLHV